MSGSIAETNLAAERLQVVSEVLDPTSEALVPETVARESSGRQAAFWLDE
jgi:hypothetical protein